ncbi:flagellin [Bartonella schoenbuchensis]|uniref:Flagellin n=1 Tax=Bartonella schoenbuchensis m07a TaxID=1094496 RepID=N6VCH5_9HYPH|nr:flagellin [Bartonella schoenbuchensis]ENN90991.1 flagellin A [Bartonella schoenbuchensis m07a]
MGSSILTNRSAMTALQTLRAIDNNLDKSKDRISTGLRINNAADNTAYWSISSMMKHDSNTMSVLVDAINLGREQISIASTAVDLTKEALDNIQQSLVSVNGKDDGDIAKLQDSIKANMKNIESAVQSSSFAGKNMLANNGQTISVAAGYRREGTSVYVDMIEIGGEELNFGVMNDGFIDMSEGILGGIFALSPKDDNPVKAFIEGIETFQAAKKAYNDKVQAVQNAKEELAKSPGDPDKVEALAEAVEDLNTDEDWANAKQDLRGLADKISLNDFTQVVIGLNGIGPAGSDEDHPEVSEEVQRILLGSLQNKVRNAVDVTLTAGAKIGSAVNLVNTQLEFVKRLQDNVDAGIGSMIDADMNAESAKLSALQVQQQLGVQALSIANQASQNILFLFRN